MRVVTVGAADIVLQVRGACEVAVFFAAFMTIEAAGADFRGGSVFESEDFGFVAAAFDVGFSRAVAGFAAMPFGAFLCVHGGYKMRRVFIGFVETL